MWKCSTLVTHLDLNKYEKILLELIIKHPGINTRGLIKKAGIGKPTFYKYLKSLLKMKLITYEKVKNQKIWIPRMPKEKDPEELMKYRLKEIQRFESIVRKAIKKVQNGNEYEVLTIYPAAINTTILYQAAIKIAIASRQGTDVPDYWNIALERLDELLSEVVATTSVDTLNFAMKQVHKTYVIGLKQMEDYIKGKKI